MSFVYIRRGLSQNLPPLRTWEPGYTTDEEGLYIGTPTGNVRLNSKVTIDTDPLMEANSDVVVPSQKAVKTALELKSDKTSVDTISSQLSNIANQKASPTQLGMIKSDGVSTVVDSNGVISAIGIGGGVVTNWSGVVTYAINDVITYQGVSFTSLQNTNLNKNPSSNPLWWIPQSNKDDAWYNYIGTNGNFLTDASGWTPYNCTISVAGKIAAITGNGTANSPQIKKTLSLSTINGTRLFVYLPKVRVRQQADYIQFYVESGTDTKFFRITNPVIDKWYDLSSFLDFTANGNVAFYILSRFADSATANNAVTEIDCTSGGIVVLNCGINTNSINYSRILSDVQLSIVQRGGHWQGYYNTQAWASQSDISNVALRANSAGSAQIMSNRWYGKKANFLGDSITSGSGASILTNRYADLVGDMLGLNTNRNYGISGSFIGTYTNADPMCTRYTAMDNDADVIFVFGGTNDYGASETLGVLGSTNNAEFYGALDTLVKGLIEKYPTKIIAFATPLHRNVIGDNTRTPSLSLYVQAVKDVCNKYSIPVLDLYNSGNFYPEDSVQQPLISDNLKLHPNDYGHILIANKIASFLRNL